MFPASANSIFAKISSELFARIPSPRTISLETVREARGSITAKAAHPREVLAPRPVFDR